VAALLAELSGGLPLVIPVAATAAAAGLHGERRRRGLNEALHELRRPLQALALTAPTDGGGETAVESSLRMTEAALERLEREVNGRARPRRRERVAVDGLLAGAASRWRKRARRSGARFDVRCAAAGISIDADPCALAQALDNLIVNALDHGAAPVSVEASAVEGRLRLSVFDAGPGPGPRRRLHRGSRRHGYGLRVVRRVAAQHGGEFRLGREGGRTAAVLELPLEAGGAER
jgi:signal transduction histidine kinase